MCLSIMSDGKNGGDIAVELFFFFYCELPCVKLLYIHTYIRAGKRRNVLGMLLAGGYGTRSALVEAARAHPWCTP
jgi:hypothetical protein